MGDGGYSPSLVPRHCHIVKWPEFSGYGFNLHAEKGKAGQFIGKVDEGSPAEAAGLKAGDRIVEVNGTNIGNENHQQVVGRIKVGDNETRLLVVDAETDQRYKEEKKVVRGDLPEVKFLTAARDEEPETQAETAPCEEDHVDSVPSALTEDTVTEGTNATEPEPLPLSYDSSPYAPRLCNLCKWPDFDGYGFNLHAEKDKPGQYIGLVDPNSPAETGGLKEGDRIIEVNGDNIEKSIHSVVIQKIKSGGDKTTMLVVDKAADDYFKIRGETVSSSMSNIVVINTPPRLTVVYAPIEDQTLDPDQLGKDQTSDTVLLNSEAMNIMMSSARDPPEWDDAVKDTTLPEPTVSLSDTEETEGSVTAVIADRVESAPVPDEAQTFYNGTEEVTAGVSAMAVAEEQNEVRGEVEFHPYEEVKVTATPTSTTTLSYQDDMGSASNGINGGSAVESQAEAAVIGKTSEPQPAVIDSVTNTSSVQDADLNLNLSAAEMKERLKSRKKQDPRQSKTSFEHKSRLFEKM